MAVEVRCRQCNRLLSKDFENTPLCYAAFVDKCDRCVSKTKDAIRNAKSVYAERLSNRGVYDADWRADKFEQALMREELS